MKYLLTILTTMLLAACGTTIPDWDRIANWDSVLVGSDGRAFCSGTIIGRGHDQAGDYSLVLSAAHCTNNSTSFEVSRKTNFAGGVITDIKTATLIGRDVATDVAIFRSSIINDGRCVPLRRSVEYHRGDVLYVLANPFIAFYSSLTMGIISAPPRAFSVMSISLSLFQADAQAAPGSSGGAVLDAEGYLVGTVTGGAPGTSISLFAPVSATNDLINKLGIGEHICYGNG